MARKRSTALAMYRAPAPVYSLPRTRTQSITIRQAKPLARRRSRHGIGHGKLDLTTAVMAGIGLGLISKLDLPAIPYLGKNGVVAIGAYFLSRQGGMIGRISRVVCEVAVATAAQNIMQTGTIQGDEDF